MMNELSAVLHNGDCVELLKNVESQSVQLILTDPPYGTTACEWDSIIPLDVMWKELERIVKPDGAIVLFGAEPFSTILRSSNLKYFRYDWIWIKTKVSSFMSAKIKPLKTHEIISVFSLRTPKYNPQPIENPTGKAVKLNEKNKGRATVWGDIEGRGELTYDQTRKHPISTLYFNSAGNTIHPTQKPVGLLEYLIATYTDSGDKVLDFTMGSGSTGVAAMNLWRGFIGFEKDLKYFRQSDLRINRARDKALEEMKQWKKEGINLRC